MGYALTPRHKGRAAGDFRTSVDCSAPRQSAETCHWPLATAGGDVTESKQKTGCRSLSRDRGDNQDALEIEGVFFL